MKERLFLDLLEFHHVGVATANLDQAIDSFGAMGYWTTDTFEDPLQGVRGAFLNGPGPQVEILAALDQSNTLEPWLRGPRTVSYHFGYLVTDIAEAIGELEAKAALVVRSPLPAVAFGGRLIAFLATRSQFLIEVIER